MREKTLNKAVGLQGQRAFPLPPSAEKCSGRSISHGPGDPEIQAWHNQFPQASAVGWWVDTAKHLWKTPEQAGPRPILVGQITAEADAITLRTRWKAQQEEAGGTPRPDHA